MKNSFLRCFIAFAALVITLGAAFSLRAEEPADPTKNYLGINMWFLNDWDGCNAFVDIIKHAREWQNYDWSGPATVDSDGWPTQDCSTVIFGTDNKTGIYKLVFNGQAGSISMMWLSGAVSDIVYTSGTNTTTADVNMTSTSGGSGGLRFQDTRRTSGSPVNTGITNIRLYRPGYATDGSQVFTTPFINCVSKFHLVRFMDWVETNQNCIETWAQRRNPNQANVGEITIGSHTGVKGLPMEHFIQLCNEINADLWINIPANATDDYVTKTAQLIRYGSDGVNPYTSPEASPVYPPLNSNLKVYVEYCNEVWNFAGGFQCFGWIHEITEAIRADPGTHPIEYDGDPGEWAALPRYLVWRGVEFSKIFRSVFSDAAMMTRVRPVYMTQLGYAAYYLVDGLRFLDNYYSQPRPPNDPTPRPPDYHLYGAGGTDYYGMVNMDPNPNTFFGAGNWPDPGNISGLEEDLLWCRTFGLKRIAYEGGMSMDPFTDPEATTLNADARMETVTLDYHTIWNQHDGDLLTYYCLNGPPRWEFTPDIDVSSTPKLDAIDELRDIRSREDVTFGFAMPGTLIARDQPLYINDGGSNGTVGGENTINDLGAGDWVSFVIHNTTGGNYDVGLRVATSAAATVEVFLNGHSQGTINIPNTVGSLADTSTLNMPIPLRSSGLRLKTTSGTYNLRSISITYASLPGVTITTTTLPNGTVGTAYSQTLAASGGVTPYAWSLASGSLPAGLGLDSSTGEISGTPTTADTSAFTVQVTDSTTPTALTDTQPLSITINAPPAIDITTASLPGGGVGIAYSQTLAATGGIPPYTWSITVGSLPAGLSLSGSSGIISGTPSAIGTSNFTVRAADGYGGQDTQPLSITVVGAPDGAPENLSALAVSSTQINLSWTDNATNESGFKVERSPDGTSSWVEIDTAAADATTYPDTGLTASATYYYRVRATNATGDSDYSNVAGATTSSPSFVDYVKINFQPVAAPVPVGYEVDAGLVYADRGAGYSYGWDADNSTYMRDREVDADQRYDTLAHMQRDGTFAWELGLPNGDYGFWLVMGEPAYFDHINTCRIEGTTYTDPDGQDYFDEYTGSFTVSDGRLSIDPTGGTNAKLCFIDLTQQVAQTAPAAPTGLNASAVSETQINLTWADNASDESGFKIERSPNGTSNWTQIATVPANVVSYSDTGLTLATIYYYRVRAYNTGGDSGYSTVDSATTQGGAPAPVYIIEVTAAATDLTLGFETVSGKTYTLLRNDLTPDLSDGGWYDAGETPITGDGSPDSFTVSKPASGTVFYTVEYEE